MLVQDVVRIIEAFAPLGFQESFDNCGLLVGEPDTPLQGVLLCVDVTPAVIDEAHARGANLVVSHHPVILGGLKSLTGSSGPQRAIAQAIRHRMAIYCAHTNLDNVWYGVNHRLATALGLAELQVLAPSSNQLVKLTTFVPLAHADAVRLAIFGAGAGGIGEYDQCSFNLQGEGTFRASPGANPFVGTADTLHVEPEVRIETVVAQPILGQVLKALRAAHPYEEVAYDIYPLANPNPRAGSGMVGNLPSATDEAAFLAHVKGRLGAQCLRHSPLLGRPVSRVAVCGGSGAQLLQHAIQHGAQVFITAEVKYHAFHDALGRIVMADVGHFESEAVAMDIFYELLTKKIANFAVLKSAVNTNPVNYL